MRIISVQVSGFRAFPNTRHFDLDANAVIVVGANGQGKTSLFDAILWALTGNVPRLGKGDANLLSLYSDTGEARVVLDLLGNDSTSCKIARTSDGDKQRLSLQLNGENISDSAATFKLLEALWPEALTADRDDALTAAVTRSVYLQQDLVRQFIEDDSEQNRFEVLSELVGAGRVSEIQRELESSRMSWSRATNVLEKDLKDERSRLGSSEAQLARLAGNTLQDQQQMQESWRRWWQQAKAMGITSHDTDPGSSQASALLDTAIKQLTQIRHTTARRHDLASQLLSDISSHPPPDVPDQAALDQELEKTQHDLDQARHALLQAQRKAAQEREDQVKSREYHEELRALAQLALRHLKDRCPVCQQQYDLVATRRRLEQLAAAPTAEAAQVSCETTVASLAASLQQRERARSNAETRLKRAEQELQNHRLWLADRDRRLRDLGIDPGRVDDANSALKIVHDNLTHSISQLVSAQEDAERLALSLARAAQSARRTEMQQEVSNASTHVEQLETQLAARRATTQLATKILDGMRDAALFVVEQELNDIVPLFRRIYAKIDPHPTFRDVSLLARMSYGHGRLFTTAADGQRNLSTESPRDLFSSSQMNALAVAVFLTFNLGMPRLPLQVAMLDDPLQSLDDVNLLGLMDLLRRTKDQRQLLVSTHERGYLQLLEHKLRPMSEKQRTVVIDFQEWSREGPVCLPRDVPQDSPRLRVAV